MSSETRRIVDPKAIRAMAHPLRWRILDLLRAEGPLTATQVSEPIGESPANCSFHLRTLAKYGFIEEAEGGVGRNRPWQAIKDVAWEVEDEADGVPVAGRRKLRAVVRGRAFTAIEEWETGGSDRFPLEWRRAAMEAEWSMPLTLAELDELQRRIKELLDTFITRQDVPPDAVQSTIYAWAFPRELPDEARHRRAARDARRGRGGRGGARAQNEGGS